MTTLAKLVAGCLVAGSIGATQGCGCGPIKGAYLTASVVRPDPTGWVEEPGLLRGRAFAAAVPIDADRYLVTGGFNAERFGGVGFYSSTAELCSRRSGCVIYSDVDPREAGGPLLTAGARAASLPDGTILSAGLIVHPDGHGSFTIVRTEITEATQVGTTVLARDARGDTLMFVDATTPPTNLGHLRGALAGAIDATHALLVATSETLVLDLDTRLVETLPGPGTNVSYVVALGTDVLVLGTDKARRFDASTRIWRDVPALAGESWHLELGSTGGAILSLGDPDAEGSVPYRLFRYRAADDTVVPLPASPGFDYGATWMEMPDGAVLRVGGAKSWFDDEASLAAA